MKRKLHLKQQNQSTKKGFTLIELLAIIVIISIVVGITSQSIINIINSSKEKEVVLSEKNIMKAANTYVQENKNIVWSVDTNTNNKISCVSIAELINQGYYDEEITSKNYNEFIIIRKDINNETIINEEFDEKGNTCNSAFQFVEKPTCADLTYNTKEQTLIDLNDENNQNKYIIEDNSTNIGQNAGTYTVKVKPDSEKFYIWKNGQNNEIEVSCTIKPAKTYIALEPPVRGDLEDEIDYSFKATPKVQLDTTNFTTDEITTINNLFKEQSGKITATSSNKEYVTTSVNPNITTFETPLEINLKANTARTATTKIKVTFTPNSSNFKKSSSTFQLAKTGIKEYTVTLNANGGIFENNTETTEIKVLKNGEYGNQLDINTPTKTGYTFDGWYTATSGGTKVTATSTINTNENHTLYAHYTAIESTVTLIGNKFSTYNTTNSGVTITYDETNSYLTLNGTQTASIKLLLSQNETFTSGDKYNITLTYISGNYTTTNYHRFVTEPKKSGGAALTTRNNLDLAFPTSGITSGTLTISSTAASEGTTLYNWIWVNSSGAITYNNYKVKITITKVVTKTIQYNSTYGSLTTPIKYGYTHTGWYDAETSGNKIASTTKVTTTTNHNLYSQWTPIKYTIAYNCNNGTGTTANSTHTFNVAKTLTSNNCSRTGYTYGGWATSSTGNVSYSDKQNIVNLSSINNATITLYAKWTAQTYTISYDANGGTSAPSSQTKTYGTNLTLSNTTPTRYGYIFNNWNTKKDGSGTKYAPGATYTSNQNITLYAQWTQANYKINTSPETYTITLKQAISKASNNNTITLLRNYTDTSTAKIDKNLTLNTGTFTLTRKNDYIYVNKNKTLIMNGSGTLTGWGLKVSGHIKFETGTIDATKSNGIITDTGSIEVTGGVIKNSASNDGGGDSAIHHFGTGTVTISGGAFYSGIKDTDDNTTGFTYAIRNHEGGTVIITGGKFYGVGDYGGGIINYANGNISITNAEVSSESRPAVYNYKAGSLSIEKSNISSSWNNGGAVQNGDISGGSKAIMTITNSTITSSKYRAIINTGGDLRIYVGSVVKSANCCAAIYNSGTYTAEGNNYWARTYVAKGEITGGSYGIYSESGNKSVHVGYKNDSLINKVNDITTTNAPIITGKNNYGVFIKNNGTSILANGVIRGNLGGANTQPCTNRNNYKTKSTKGSTYKRYYLESGNTTSCP